MSTIPVKILRRGGAAPVAATLIELRSPEQLVDLESEWAPARQAIVDEMHAREIKLAAWPQSWHWRWGRKAPDLRFAAKRCFAIRCNAATQGAMLTDTVSHLAKLPADRGRPIVYVEYLEAAPWNWNVPLIAQLGSYRGVGSLLLRRAVIQSVDEGFHGRLGLHALPQADAFYATACGMSAVGPDLHDQDLMYFEFSREAAERFLRKRGTGK